MAAVCSLERRVARAALIFLAAGGLSCQSGVSTRGGSPVSAGTSSGTPSATSSGGSRSEFFASVRPLIDANCIRCHGVKFKKAELDLRTAEGIRKGSENGPVIVAGDAQESRLYQLVSEGKMPPGRSKRLAAEEVETIRRWIEGGARF